MRLGKRDQNLIISALRRAIGVEQDLINAYEGITDTEADAARKNAQELIDGYRDVLRRLKSLNK